MELNHNSPLNEWLDFILSQHPINIDMSLDRVYTVWKRMNIERPAPITITVAGTNGKGSTSRVIEAILSQAGFNVLVFSSPHLVDYRERIRLNQRLIKENLHSLSFAIIHSAALEETLTYFEYSTLSALWLSKHLNVDVCILEVGLGGRLDATNIVDADLAVITNIDIDHTEYLGNTREEIGAEKAGIIRFGKPVIFGDSNPVNAINEVVTRNKCPFYVAERDFHMQQVEHGWVWSMGDTRFVLPNLNLASSNVSTAMAAIQILNKHYLTKLNNMNKGDTRKLAPEVFEFILGNLTLPGRYQTLTNQMLSGLADYVAKKKNLDEFEGLPKIIIDVGHNAHASTLLAKQLYTTYASLENPGKIYAIFSMLNDKDIHSTIQPLINVINKWFLVTIDNGGRSNSAYDISRSFLELDPRSYYEIDENSHDALVKILIENDFSPNDIILVFGSFIVVSDLLNGLKINYDNLSKSVYFFDVAPVKHEEHH